jgi:hypothetical protein
LIYLLVPQACCTVRSSSVAFINHLINIIIVVMHIGML